MSRSNPDTADTYEKPTPIPADIPVEIGHVVSYQDETGTILHGLVLLTEYNDDGTEEALLVPVVGVVIPTANAKVVTSIPRGETA